MLFEPPQPLIKPKKPDKSDESNCKMTFPLTLEKSANCREYLVSSVTLSRL